MKRRESEEGVESQQGQPFLLPTLLWLISRTIINDNPFEEQWTCWDDATTG